MPPSLTTTLGHFTVPKKETLAPENKFNYTPGKPQQQPSLREYEELLPCYPGIHHEELSDIVPYEDKGIRGDPGFRTLLSDASDVFDYGPKIGTEIVGLDLGKVNDAQRDELARLVATRGVVVLRDQGSFDVQAQRELGSYLGRLYTHPMAAVPRKEGLDDVQVIYTDATDISSGRNIASGPLWQSDVSYELHPPSYTSMKLLSGPPRSGSNMIYSSLYAAYDALSAHMQTYLKNLTALHSADREISGAQAAKLPVRRQPVTTEHPLIRTNPVTGWNALFFNPTHVIRIVGVSEAESDAVTRYLTEVVSTTHHTQARVQLRSSDVAIWDSRVTTHTSMSGFTNGCHAIQVTCHGDRPGLDPGGVSQEESVG